MKTTSPTDAASPDLILRDGTPLGITVLDEALFPIEGVLDFSAELTASEGRDRLHLHFQVAEGEMERVARKALAALLHSETVGVLFRRELLSLGSMTFGAPLGKLGGRRIVDRRAR